MYDTTRKPSEPETKRPRLVKLARRPRGPRKCINSDIISLALISYIISNQMAVIILGTSSPIVPKGDILEYDITENMIDTKTQSYKLSAFERSLVQLVAASPAPLPSAVHVPAPSATSRSHRAPPMNGSIFGRR